MKVVRKMAANLSRICHFPTKMHQRRYDSARDEAISALKDVGSLAPIKYERTVYVIATYKSHLARLS